MTTALGDALVDLLGETRAQVVELLRRQPHTVADLAAALSLSEVAIRKHVAALERDGLVDAETVRRDGPGRPASAYALSAKGRRLYPDQSAAFASDLLDYVESTYGRQALLGFLRWRQARQGDHFRDALADAETPQERVQRLAEVLDAEGFMAKVTAPEGGHVLELTQHHCAISEVAREHPELCAYEAAAFQKVLGVPVSRRETIAGGAPACVCTIRTPDTGVTDGHEG